MKCSRRWTFIQENPPEWRAAATRPLGLSPDKAMLSEILCFGHGKRGMFKGWWHARRSSSMNATPTRRDFLYGLGATLGTVALNSLLQAEPRRSTTQAAARPLAPRPPH